MLRRTQSSVEKESSRLQELERSISSRSLLNSQALLSVEREVFRLRLQASTAARSDSQLLCDSIEARILKAKALVGLTGSSLRGVDCGEYFNNVTNLGLISPAATRELLFLAN